LFLIPNVRSVLSKVLFSLSYKIIQSFTVVAL